MNRFIENGVEQHPYSLKGISGIYKIVNNVNGKFYLGRANNIYSRFLVHRAELNKRIKSHKDSPLGRAWSKYGENSFYLEVIERVPKDKLKEIEQKHLDKLNPYDFKVGYNQDKSSTGFTTESATKCIKRQMLGGRVFDGANNPSAKLSTDQAIKIREKYCNNISVNDLCKEYSISKVTIYPILRGTSVWIKAEDLLSYKVLSSEERKEISRLKQLGLSTKSLMIKFNCSKHSIYRAIKTFS